MRAIHYCTVWQADKYKTSMHVGGEPIGTPRDKPGNIDWKLNKEHPHRDGRTHGLG